MKVKKNTKGITLIVLVVTIVVLLTLVRGFVKSGHWG